MLPSEVLSYDELVYLPTGYLWKINTFSKIEGELSLNDISSVNEWNKG